MAEKFFSHLGTPPTPADLFQKVLTRLDREVERQARQKRIALAAGFFVMALAVLIPSGLALPGQITTSGLPQFLSLIFSDFSVVVAHYQSFLLSVLEVFPFFSVAFVFLGLLLFVEALRIFAADTKKSFLKPNLKIK